MRNRKRDCHRLLHVDIPGEEPVAEQESDCPGLGDLMVQQRDQLLGGRTEEQRQAMLARHFYDRVDERDCQTAFDLEVAAGKEFIKNVLLPNSRPARKTDYARWLRGWMRTYKETPKESTLSWWLMSDKWVVLNKSITLRPLYGVDAYCIIVPKGVRARFNPMEGLGHIEVYDFMAFLSYGVGGRPCLFSDMDTRTRRRRALDYLSETLGPLFSD